MNIDRHILIVVLVCSLGGACLSVGLARGYRNLANESAHVGEDSLVMRELDKLKTLVSEWSASCDSLVAPGETSAARSVALQADRIENLLSALRAAITQRVGRNELTVISHSVGTIAQAVETASMASGPERASLFAKLSERLDAESTKAVGALDALAKRTSQRLANAKTSVDAQRTRLATTAWVFGGVYLAVVFVVWRWACYSVVRPLRSLSKQARTDALGQTPLGQYKKAPTEIVEVARAIATFVDHLDAARTHTEQSNSENRDLAARFSAILDNAADGVITINEHGCIELFNAAAEEIFGYSAAEVVGKSVTLLMPTPERERLDGYIRRYLDTDEKTIIGSQRETIGLRTDGTTVPLDLGVSEVRLGTGRIFTSIIRDISDRKEAEKTLRLRVRQQAAIAELGHRALGGERLETLLDHAVAVVAETLDMDYCKVLELLPERNELLLRTGVGWKPGLVGNATVDTGADSQAGYTLVSNEPVIVDDLRAETRFSGPKLLSEHGVVSGMSTVICGKDRPFGVLGVHTTARRKFSREDTHFLSAVANVLADAIERSNAEDQLREAHARSEAANLAKSEFLSNISHEFQTPMNGIVGMCALALDTDLNAEQREYLDTVMECSDSLSKLLNNILDFSKIEGGNVELETRDFDLVATVNGVVDILAQRAEGKGLKLNSIVDPSVPRILRGDPGRLRQVLVNLVDNAIKFTDHGEMTIDVRVEACPKRGDSLFVSVSDTGIGIPQDRHSGIFDRFAQADGTAARRYGGTGLGLAMCKQILDLMGGEIWVESEPERGSTFCFRTPLEYDRRPTRHEDRQTSTSSVADGAAHSELLPLTETPVDPSLGTTSITPSRATIDIEKALQQLDDDREVLLEVLNLFVETAPALLADVRSAVSSGDNDKLRSAAHSIKGAASNICAEPVRRVAQLLEEMGRRHDLTNVDAAVTDLGKHLEQLRATAELLDDD